VRRAREDVSLFVGERVPRRVGVVADPLHAYGKACGVLPANPTSGLILKTSTGF
jgi:hypothetical protein